MSRALAEYMITGVKTTIPFQQAILHSRRGAYSTNFADQLLSGARRELIEEKAQTRSGQLPSTQGSVNPLASSGFKNTNSAWFDANETSTTAFSERNSRSSESLNTLKLGLAPAVATSAISPREVTIVVAAPTLVSTWRSGARACVCIRP
jgi:pyruvate carboxylase